MDPGPSRSCHARTVKPAAAASAASAGARAAELAATLRGVARGEAHTAAEALLAACAQDHLRLQGLPAHWEDLPYRLPATSWRVLQQQVRLGTGKDITAVDLPAASDGAQLAAMVAGLAELPGLERIQLRVPRSGRLIDLGALAPRPDGLTVCLDCNRVAEWVVRVPSGTQVYAIGAATALPHPAKPRVYYTDASGRWRGASSVIGNLIHQREPTEFRSHADPAAVAGANRNGLARFPPQGTGDGQPIVCRHLALQWLDDREARAPARLPGRQRFSCKGFASTAAIAAHVSPTTESRMVRMLDRDDPVSVFHPEDLGRFLQAQGRTLRPGEARRFLLTTWMHALGLELQCKRLASATGRDRAWVATLYDPNQTATHLRVLLHELATLQLDLLSFWEHCPHAYFPHPGHPLVAAWAVGAAAAQARAAATAPMAIRPAARESPTFIAQMMAWGQLPQVEAALALACALRDARADPGAAERRLFSQSHGRGALRAAIEHSRFDEAARYLDAVLALPSALRPAQRVHLLSSVAEDRPDPQGILRASVGAGALEWVALYARRVLAAPDSVLGPESRRELVGGTGFVSELLQGGGPASTAADRCIPRGLYALAHEIAVSCRLSPADKLSLLGLADPLAATAGRLGATACVACAIVDAQPGEPDACLLAALRPVVLRMLRQALHAVQRHELPWVQHLLAQRHLFGALGDTAAWAVSRFGAAEPVRGDTGLRALLRSRDGLAFWGERAHRGSHPYPQLRAVGLDSNPAFVLCAAPREIPALAPWLLASGTRWGSAMGPELTCYLLPRARLQPLQAPSPLPDRQAAKPAVAPWRVADAAARPDRKE